MSDSLGGSIFPSSFLTSEEINLMLGSFWNADYSLKSNIIDSLQSDLDNTDNTILIVPEFEYGSEQKSWKEVIPYNAKAEYYEEEYPVQITDISYSTDQSLLPALTIKFIGKEEGSEEQFYWAKKVYDMWVFINKNNELDKAIEYFLNVGNESISSELKDRGSWYHNFLTSNKSVTNIYTQAGMIPKSNISISGSDDTNYSIIEYGSDSGSGSEPNINELSNDTFVYVGVENICVGGLGSGDYEYIYNMINPSISGSNESIGSEEELGSEGSIVDIGSNDSINYGSDYDYWIDLIGSENISITGS